MQTEPVAQNQHFCFFPQNKITPNFGGLIDQQNTQNDENGQLNGFIFKHKTEKN
jgi:hypothetical protein